MKSLVLLAASLCVLNAGYIKEALSAKDDHNKLAQIYEDACDKEKKASGCNNYAIMLAEGKGVKEDVEKAREIFTKSCKNGLKEACENLEILGKN